MRLNKTLKRIVALGTGLTTLGATFLGAMAQADLADYPTQFINNGVFDGFIVLGDNAAAKDVIGAVEISTAMQAASVTTTTVAAEGSRGTVSLSGNSFKVEESADNLNLYENLSDVTDVVSDTDWDMLADGEISNSKGTFDYEQLLYLPGARVVFDVDNDRDDEDPHLYLYFPETTGTDNVVDTDGTDLLVYRISFPSALKTDVDSSDDLDDLEDEVLNILGKEFTFITTDNSSTNFVLLGGSYEATMTEGEEKTITVGVGEDAKTFTVKVNAIEDGTSDNRVFFTVNGNSVDGLKEGETETINDERDQLAVKEVINVDGQEESGIGDQVTFIIGAKKLELSDSASDYSQGTSATNAGTIDFNGETVSDLTFDVRGSSSGSEVSITSFDFASENSEDYYVGVGESLRERILAEGDEEDLGLLIFDTLDIRFEGLDTNQWETIKIEDKSDTRYEVDVTNTAGQGTNIPFAYLNATSENQAIKPGKENGKPLVLDYDGGFGLNLTQNGFFMVTDDDTSRNSHLLTVGNVDTTNKEVTIKGEGTGASDLDITYDSTTLQAEFVLNGKTYTVHVIEQSPRGLNLTTLQTVSGVQANQNSFYSEYGAKLTFNDNSSLINTTAKTTVQLAENPKDSRDDSGSKYNLYFDLAIKSGSTTEIGTITVASDDPMWSAEKSLDSTDNRRQSMTSYGTMTERDTDNDQQTVEITYGQDEAVANVFLTVGETTAVQSSGSSEGTVTSTTVNQISVGASKLASEVPDITAVNAIVVGGPCANAAAAQLTGVANSVPECLSGLTLEAGNAIIKLYEDAVTGKIAVLVAGATADDTRRAARVLSDYENYAMVGTEVSVSGTSMTDITVSQVTSSSASSGESMEEENMEESEEGEEETA